MAKEDIREKYLQMQLLQQQIEEVSKQVGLFSEQNENLEVSIFALQELSNTPLNTEALTPVANGIFMKTELKDNQKLVINAGSGVAVERTIPEVIAILQQQQETVTANLLESEKILQELNQELVRIYHQLQEAQRSQEEEKTEEKKNKK